jgi:hypothetical protein
MSHLVCTEHARRVLVLPSSTVVHRENGHICDSSHVRQGTVVMTSKAVVDRDKQLHTI